MHHWEVVTDTWTYVVKAEDSDEAVGMVQEVRAKTEIVIKGVRRLNTLLKEGKGIVYVN